MTLRGKKLVECEPEELNVPMLLALSDALIAKLILVNSELLRRTANIVSLSRELTDVEDARQVLVKSTERMMRFQAVLEAQLEWNQDAKKQCRE